MLIFPKSPGSTRSVPPNRRRRRERPRRCCRASVGPLEVRTLLSGTAGGVLAAVATRIKLGTPTAGTLAPGEDAFFQIDSTADGRLVARVHSESVTTRLSLLNG